MDIRPLRVDDAEELGALVRRFERFWEIEWNTPDSQMREELTQPFVDPALDTRGYWLEGDLVAYGLVWHRPSGERLERSYLQGLVDPSFRGQGIGRHLLGWEIERARERLAATDPSLPKHIQVDEWDWIEDAHRLYKSMGFQPVRYFTDMIRTIDEPVAVNEIDGVRIVPFDRSLDEQVRTAWNESFSDHWRSTPLDQDAYRHRVEEEGTSGELSFLAAAGDEVVGLSLNAHFPEDEEVIHRREGWIEILGVKPEWRGRGIARALIQTSINAFVAAGFTHAALNVDTENRSGAHGLYTNLGFEPFAGTITHELVDD